MECDNCGSVKTVGCGRMERFQKSGRCVTGGGLFFVCLFFYNVMSPWKIGGVGFLFFFLQSEKDLRRQITQIAFEQLAASKKVCCVCVSRNQHNSLCLPSKNLDLDFFPAWLKIEKTLDEHPLLEKYLPLAKC